MQDPINLIEDMLRHYGLRQQDLVGVIGSKSRVSEIMNRKRKLSIKNVRNLVDRFGLPADLLILDYEVKP